MSNFKLILEYNGEGFSGSQIQNFKKSNVEIEDCEQSQRGTARNRTSSRLRRTNDRSVLRVHEDHEDDENAENGVVQWSERFYARGCESTFAKPCSSNSDLAITLSSAISTKS